MLICRHAEVVHGQRNAGNHCYKFVLLQSFRQSRAGGELPAARTLSNELNDDRVVKSTSMSAMHVQFGQYITHDLTHALPKKSKRLLVMFFVFYLHVRTF